MLSFHPLNIQDKESVHGILKAVDKANGYVFTGMEGDNLAATMGTAISETDWKYNQAAAFQELYMDGTVEALGGELGEEPVRGAAVPGE